MFFTIALPFIAWRYFRDTGWRVAVSLTSLGLTVLDIVLIKTRGAWLGLAAAAIFALASGAAPRLLARRRKVAVLAGIALAGVVAVAIIAPRGGS